MHTFYDILKISRNATQEEILNAYRKRCIETHPDKGGNEIEFLNVRKGYEILSNPTKRAAYDKWVLQKEKEELEKEIQRLKFEKEKYSRTNQNTNKNSKKSIPYSFIFGVMIVIVIGLVLYSENEQSNTRTPPKDNVPSSYNSYTFKKDSKWLYDELSKDIHTMGTYEDFIEELQDPAMAGYYYREAKRLKLNIGTKNDFNKLLIADGIIKQEIEIKDKVDKSNSFSNTNNTVKKINSSVDNVLSKYNSSKIATKSTSESNNEITYKETIYKTGDSPYANYFGNGKRKGQYDKNSLSKLTITNYSSKEAVVLLEKTNGTVIRNVYIKNNSEYKLTNIPEGYYRIKVMYGNSWNSEKDNGKNFPKGGFMKNVSFTKSRDNDMFNYTFEETYDGISYPTYSITLHKVKDGNMKTENISKEDFFY